MRAPEMVWGPHLQEASPVPDPGIDFLLPGMTSKHNLR